MNQEEQDKADELNHLSIVLGEYERAYGEKARRYGVTKYELILQCNSILSVLGNISRTGVADLDRVAKKVAYWNNILKANQEKVENLESGEWASKEYVSLAGITGAVQYDKEGKVLGITLPEGTSMDKAREFGAALGDRKIQSFIWSGARETPSAHEWAEEMELFIEIRNRILASLEVRNFLVTRHEVDETHIIRLWVETEAFNQAPNVFTVVNNVLREYPSHEPKVVVHLKTVKVERTETHTMFTIGG